MSRANRVNGGGEKRGEGGGRRQEKLNYEARLWATWFSMHVLKRDISSTYLCLILWKVKCVFITDGSVEDQDQHMRVMQERNRYKDIELQPLQGGREFGLRFLNQIKWAKAKFDFQHLLRMDDDYFLCLKRLIAELPTRPKENLIWGYFHCEAGITWIDEAFMIFSQDVIYKFLSQNDSTMLCHVHADQQIGLWLNNIPEMDLLYFHDTRLYHHPPASFSPQFDNITNVCDWYLALHGTYEEKMRYFGLNENDGTKNVFPIPNFSFFCQTTRFDYRQFEPKFRFEPKPCKDNPSWGLERTMFVGRENSTWTRFLVCSGALKLSNRLRSLL